MRILYAVGSQPNGALMGSDIWSRNIKEALVSLGHEVVPLAFDLAPYYRYADPARNGANEFHRDADSDLDAALMQQLDAMRSAGPVDMLFTYFYSNFVQPTTIATIGREGVVTVNWFCNASYQFQLVRDIAPVFDFCLVPERDRLVDYSMAGASPIYCQEAADPEFYCPRGAAKSYGVGFVGAAYGDRPGMVHALEQSGLDVRAWGPGWERLGTQLTASGSLRRAVGQLRRAASGQALHPPRLSSVTCGPVLSDEAMVETISRTRISLGFSTVGSTAHGSEPIRQVRLRDFEVPMTGTFYLLEYVEEIEDFFVPDKEIVCFRDRDELVEKAIYYLAHEGERERIAAAGRTRALADHTWRRRLAAAFAEMGLG